MPGFTSSHCAVVNYKPALLWLYGCIQVVFLNELEEVLELMGAEQVEKVLEPLFRTVAKCVGSRHFQVCFPNTPDHGRYDAAA